MINLALYGSHNAAIAVEIDGKVVLVTELERIINEKIKVFLNIKLLNLMIFYFIVSFYLNGFVINLM